MNYVEMIDDLRTVVYKNIRELGGTTSTTNDHIHPPPPPSSSSSVIFHSNQPNEVEMSHSPQHASSGEEEEQIADQHSNKTFMKKIRGTTKKTIQQAEEGFIKLDNVIRQLRTSIQKK
jgi:hypothetical protein